jgi:hypothetical protein
MVQEDHFRVFGWHLSGSAWEEEKVFVQMRHRAFLLVAGSWISGEVFLGAVGMAAWPKLNEKNVEEP